MIPAAGPFGSSARSRLLPISVPFRYFGAAVAFQVLAWAVLLASTDELAAYAGGPGPLLAALHLTTLGVLAMTAVGATLQLLPVATRQPVLSIRAAKGVWWLLVPGVALFALGAALYRPLWMGAGAFAAALALLVYAVLLAANLHRARGMRVIVAHGWAALAALALLVASGFSLAAGYVHGFAFERASLAALHLVFAAYGFMGLLVLGLSHLLLPMFALSPAPRHGAAVLGVAFAGLALALAGALSGAAGATLGAGAAGLGAALAHVATMERALRARLRANLGAEFLLVRVSWVLLVASLALGLALLLDRAPPYAAALFGVLLVPGWLLTFLLGVLQRIAPFLASVHAHGANRRAPLASELTPAGALALHRVLHLGALAALIGGLAAGNAALARFGAMIGLAGSLAYALFFAGVLTRLRALRSAAPAGPRAVDR